MTIPHNPIDWVQMKTTATARTERIMNFKVTAKKTGKKTETPLVDKWDVADLLERYCALGYSVTVELVK